VCAARTQVIYGDTDSIMVHTNSDDINAAHDLAGRIKREINKRCVCVHARAFVLPGS